MKLFPGLDKYEEASLNDYDIIKLQNFFATTNYKKLRLRTLYTQPKITDGVLTNGQSEFGAVVGEGQTFTSVHNHDKPNMSLIMEQIKNTSTTGVIRAGKIYALVLVDEGKNTNPLIVYQLKRPIDVTSSTVLATQTGKFTNYQLPHPFSFKKYNSQFNKDERFYGFLTTSKDLLPGQTIVGKLRGTMPLSEQAEIDYVTKLLLELKDLRIPFDPFGASADVIKATFDSDLTFTATSKTYQLVGEFTIPRDSSQAPDVVMFKPKTTGGFDEDLAFVIIKFDRFGRGGKFGISTSVTLE